MGDALYFISTSTTSVYPASTAEFRGVLFSLSRNKRIFSTGYPTLCVCDTRERADPQRVAT